MPNGPEQRTAVNDGNAGYVSAPSVRHTASQSSVAMNKQQSVDSKTIGNVGSQLSAAFGKYAKEEAAHIKEQRKLSGVAKAGMKRSMDEVDVDVKQTKFTDYLFGEDVEYRAAQQQVITNGVEAKYREELANLEQYQGYTEREYGAVIKESLNQLADQYKDDPETKALATDAWIKGAGKLVNKQHKAHFAYKQTEMTRIERETTKGRIDQMVIEEGEVTSAEDVKDYNHAWDRLASTGTRSAGMTEIVKRNQLHEIVQEQLASGNVTAYRQFNMRGFYDDATPEEAAGRDKAIGKYDTNFGRRVNTTLEETVAAMEKVTDFDDAQAMVTELSESVNQHELRGSGSDKGNDIIAEARSRVAKMIPDLMKKTAAASKKGDDLNAAREALRKKGFDGGKERHPFKKKVLDEGRDLNFAEDVGNLTGEELSAQEATARLFTDGDVGRMFINNFRQGDEVVPVLQSGMKGMLDGIESMEDPETGAPNEQWKQAMTFMSGLDEASSVRMKKNLGDQYMAFKFYEQQTRANVPAKEMRKNFNMLQENLANKSAYTGTMNLPSGVDKRQFVLERMGMGNIAPQAGSDLVKQFDEGMALYKGDVNLAIDYAKTNYNAESMTVGNGVVIQNAGRLNADLGGYDIQAVFAYIDGNEALGTDMLRGMLGDTLVQPKSRGFVADLFGDDREAKPPSKLEQVKGLEIEVAADGDGLLMSAPNGRTRRLTTENIKQLVQQLEAQNKQDEFEYQRTAAVQTRKALAMEKQRHDLWTISRK